MDGGNGSQFGDAPWWLVMLLASPGGVWLIKAAWPLLRRLLSGRTEQQSIRLIDELRGRYLAEVRDRVRDHARQQELIRRLESENQRLNEENAELRARLQASGSDR